VHFTPFLTGKLSNLFAADSTTQCIVGASFSAFHPQITLEFGGFEDKFEDD